MTPTIKPVQVRATVTTVALLPVLRELLRAAGAEGRTLGELRQQLLGLDVQVESPELSSCMVKLKDRGEVTRKKEARGDALGRRRVYRYTWVGVQSAPAMSVRVIRST